MARVLLIGSGNRDKRDELTHLLAGSDWDVKSLKDFDPVDEPEETEETFEGNALLKARYYSKHFGLPCVADDSGIEVDALDGAPGVYSARYAGEDCTYADNNNKLLDAIRDVPEDRRTARFVSCAAFVDTDGTEHVELGTVEGTLAHESSGENGFGYDPLFVPEGFDKTFGHFSREDKATVSHRGKAFRAMCAYLEDR